MAYRTNILAAAALGALAIAAAPAAEARVYVGVGIGTPCCAPAYYAPYYPSYPYGSYYSYYGAPPAYAPQPYPYPAPYAAGPASSSPYQGYPYSAPPGPPANSEAGDNCREYQRTILIDGQPQKGYGTACHQPDGSWKLVD